jgi:anaerobic magnesium-protoporphyrin IX monomethyl ester cyclase
MITSPRSPPKVLIVTGGYLSARDEGIGVALWKQVVQSRHSRHAWLEAKVKATIAEPILTARWHAWRHHRRVSPALRALLSAQDTLATPELTEVVLATALARESMAFELLTYDDLLRGTGERDRKLRDCTVVFASSTFLRDLSELEPLLARLRRPWNRVVVGGALAGTLHAQWEGSPLVDILAVGYGERLVPALAAWIRSGFRTLQPPEGGRVVHRRHTQLLFSGVPSSRSLDDLERPDWALVARRRGQRYRMIHYESVRGCPYRCAFCNYPYLFDDTKFRTRSAERMADDWAFYVETLGVEYITCLDSLFTMPRSRLVAFCRALLARGVRVKWICYARADDLCEPDVVALMRSAGCVQVQIGIESGDQGQLDRMNKRTTVRDNLRALATCRAEGLTTLVSLVVGYPGETADTLRATCDVLAQAPPDFHFLAAFSTRVASVPVLQPENAQRFGLVTDDNPRTVSPYWLHDTMSCTEVGGHVRTMTRELARRRISLDASVFYRGILHYTPALRDEMLAFQAAALGAHPRVTRVFDWLHRWIDGRLRRDVAATMSRHAGAAVPMAPASPLA